MVVSTPAVLCLLRALPRERPTRPFPVRGYPGRSRHLEDTVTAGVLLRYLSVCLPRCVVVWVYARGYGGGVSEGRFISLLLKSLDGSLAQGFDILKRVFVGDVAVVTVRRNPKSWKSGIDCRWEFRSARRRSAERTLEEEEGGGGVKIIASRTDANIPATSHHPHLIELVKYHKLC